MTGKLELSLTMEWRIHDRQDALQRTEFTTDYCISVRDKSLTKSEKVFFSRKLQFIIRAIFHPNTSVAINWRLMKTTEASINIFIAIGKIMKCPNCLFLPNPLIYFSCFISYIPELNLHHMLSSITSVEEDCWGWKMCLYHFGGAPRGQRKDARRCRYHRSSWKSDGKLRRNLQKQRKKNDVKNQTNCFL